MFSNHASPIQPMKVTVEYRNNPRYLITNPEILSFEVTAGASQEILLGQIFQGLIFFNSSLLIDTESVLAENRDLRGSSKLWTKTSRALCGLSWLDASRGQPQLSIPAADGLLSFRSSGSCARISAILSPQNSS